MQHSHREVNRLSASREILHFVRNLKVLRFEVLVALFLGVQVFWDFFLNLLLTSMFHYK